jgi:hypothetical protein
MRNTPPLVGNKAGSRGDILSKLMCRSRAEATSLVRASGCTSVNSASSSTIG